MNKQKNISSINEKYFFLQSGLYTYILTLLCFSPFIFHFTWGNHDWQWVKEYTPLDSGLFEGRFSQFILQTLLFDGNILPVLTIITAFGCFSIATILLLRLWELPTQRYLYLLFGINIICAPYTLSWLYFAFINLSIFSWILAIILAFYLLNNLSKQKYHFITATILFTLALGGYPPVINLIGTIFCTLILQSLCLKKQTIKTIIHKYLPHFCSIIIAISCFLCILFLLKKYHLMYETYNTAGITKTNILPKLYSSLQSSLTQLLTTTIFITPTYKYCGLCLFLLALLRLWTQLPKNILYILAFIFILSGLLFSSVITLFMAENAIFVKDAPRIEFFSLPYIYTFSAIVLYKTSSPLIRNTTYILISLAILNNFTNIAYASKIWKFGFQSEMSMSERILARIEQTPQFDTEKKYTFIQSGTLDFRSRYLLPTETSTRESYTLTAPYIPWHLPSKAYKFYYPTDIFGQDFDIYWRYINPNFINMTSGLEAYISYMATPWPNPKSIYLDEQTIILTLTYDGKNWGRSWLYNAY